MFFFIIIYFFCKLLFIFLKMNLFDFFVKLLHLEFWNFFFQKLFLAPKIQMKQF